MALVPGSSVPGIRYDTRTEDGRIVVVVVDSHEQIVCNMNKKTKLLHCCTRSRSDIRQFFC